MTAKICPDPASRPPPRFTYSWIVTTYSAVVSIGIYCLPGRSKYRPRRHSRRGTAPCWRATEILRANLIVVLRGKLSAAHNGAAGEHVRLPSAVAPCTLDKVAVLSGAKVIPLSNSSSDSNARR